MPQTSYPYVGQATTDVEYTRLFREFSDDGVIANGSSNELQVSAPGGTMTVQVRPGTAIVRGYFYRTTDVETLTLDPSTTQSRIDAVALQLNVAAPQVSDRIKLVIKKGTNAASNPLPPSMNKNETGVYEIPLAYIAVAPNAANIVTSAVTDQRSFTDSGIGRWPSDAHRPLGPTSTPRKYKMGFNETRGYFEWYNGNAWVRLLPSLEWADVTGKPTTFTPSAHTHTVANVTGLQGLIDVMQAEIISKSDNGHNHDNLYYRESEITALLNGKQNNLGFNPVKRDYAGNLAMNWSNGRLMAQVDISWMNIVTDNDINGYGFIKQGQSINTQGGYIASLGSRNSSVSSNYASLYADGASGLFGIPGSFREFKKQIEELGDDWIDIFLDAAKPISFLYNEDADDTEPHWGLLGDDLVDAGLDALVVYSWETRVANEDEIVSAQQFNASLDLEDPAEALRAVPVPEAINEIVGEPKGQGIRYEYLTVPLVLAAKAQREQIRDLTTRLEALEKKA